jgi:transposase
MPIASEEKRRLALDALNDGEHPKDVARLFQAGVSSVYRWLRQNKTGQVGPRPTGNRPRSIGQDDEARLLALVNNKPDMTLEELKAALNLDCHPSTIHRTLKRLGLSFKKNTACRRARKR